MTTGTRSLTSGKAASFERFVVPTLRRAEIEVGGSRPWDIKIHDRRFFRRVVLEGSLGLGDSYLEGWWDCDDLGTFFHRLIAARSQDQRTTGIPGFVHNLRRKLFNLQGKRRAKQVVNSHYDLPTALFETMLGPSMTYSCAYWQGTVSLEQAQENKLDLICRKLGVAPGDRILELGCGFGSFARHASRRYGCTVVGVTLSGAQARYARSLCDGLPVEIHQADYRDLQTYSDGKPFSRIVSIAMFEAVGRRSFRGFMEVVDRLLQDGGSWLLHTIGDAVCSSDPWLDKHIFPNGELPSHDQIEDAARSLFSLHDTHEFGSDYALTLAAWETNFRRGWHELRRSNPRVFDGRFFRKWIYYLSCCRGAFLAGDLYLWQILMAREPAPAQYRPVR